MITTAITAAIAAVLSFFGIPPGPYIAGVWLLVKLLIVLTGVLLGARLLRKKPEPATLQISESQEKDSLGRR